MLVIIFVGHKRCPEEAQSCRGRDLDRLGVRGPAKTKSISAKKQAAQTDSQTNLQYNGCKNMLHACTRIMANADFVERLRLIVAIFRSMRNEHSKVTKQMNSLEGTLSYYVEQAQWGWLKPLVAALDVCTDLPCLSRSGFTCDLHFGLRKTLDDTSPKVALEDALANRAWSLLSHLITERASSMIRYTSSYPYRLAKVLSDDPAVQVEAFAEFSVDWRGFSSAMSVPLAKGTTDRCSLNCRAMHDVARVFRKFGWAVCDETVGYTKRLFGGYMQEKICEDVLKQCREQETRDQSSQIIKRWRIYDAGTSGKVIESWGRPEVQVHNDMFPERIATDTFLFQHDGQARQGVPLAGIRDKLDWVTWDAQSIKRQACIDEALRYAVQCEDLEVLPELWRAKVVPVRQFIVNREQKELWFTVYTSDTMVLAWPCVRLAAGIVALGRHVQKLEWKVVFVGPPFVQFMFGWSQSRWVVLSYFLLVCATFESTPPLRNFVLICMSVQPLRVSLGAFLSEIRPPWSKHSIKLSCRPCPLPFKREGCGGLAGGRSCAVPAHFAAACLGAPRSPDRAPRHLPQARLPHPLVGVAGVSGIEAVGRRPTGTVAGRGRRRLAL